MTFTATLSNIVGAEVTKRIGFAESVCKSTFRFGNVDIDEANAWGSVRMNEVCHQKTGGFSEEMTIVVLCQKAMTGRFLYVESPTRFNIDDLQVILRKK